MKLTLFKIVLFACFAVAAVVGLFVFATYNGSKSDASATGKVVIWGVLPQAAMANAFATLQQTNTDLKDISYQQVSETDLPSTLATAIATGNGPDLILASQEELRALSKLLQPIAPAQLSARTFTTNYIGEGSLLLDPATGGYFGVPFLVDPLALFSNSTILASDGIATVPASWDALTGLAPTVAVLTPTRQISRALIALGSYANVHDARGILSALFLQTGVPISGYNNASGSGLLSADLGQSVANGVPPGQSVVRFYTQFADPTKMSYTWNASLPDSQQAFLAGNLALYLGYVSEASYLRAANPNLAFGVSPLPQATGSAKVTYGLLYSFMVPKGAKNPSGALAAAVLLTQPAAEAVFASAFGLAPAVRSALATVPNDAVLAVAYEEALYASGWLSPLPSDTDTVFSGMIQNVISGRTTPAAALSTAESTLSALLQQQ
jgi:ABC-type glycerol-3-phosphate transport system substrate-binding protein